jgi:hypothetical protein
MNIKELLLEGCRISIPYKVEKEEWVGETKIHIFEGGFGCLPKIIVEGDYCNGYQKEFEIEQIDEAIKYFNDHAFNKENLMYKRNPAMLMVTKDIPDIDLEDKTDYMMIEKIRLKLINDKKYERKN